MLFAKILYNEIQKYEIKGDIFLSLHTTSYVLHPFLSEVIFNNSLSMGIQMHLKL